MEAKLFRLLKLDISNVFNNLDTFLSSDRNNFPSTDRKTVSSSKYLSKAVNKAFYFPENNQIIFLILPYPAVKKIHRRNTPIIQIIVIEQYQNDQYLRKMNFIKKVNPNRNLKINKINDMNYQCLLDRRQQSRQQKKYCRIDHSILNSKARILFKPFVRPFK